MDHNCPAKLLERFNETFEQPIQAFQFFQDLSSKCVPSPVPLQCLTDLSQSFSFLSEALLALLQRWYGYVIRVHLTTRRIFFHCSLKSFLKN